jgi:hypothetical protein
MAQESVSPQGVTEAAGSYNQHARLQAAGGSIAARFLEDAAREITAVPADRPIVMADYGSSQGKNSLVPIGAAIRVLRSRFGPERSIFVFHIDQPPNDFNTLFQVLSSDPLRYVSNDANVFPGAVGRSFYEEVLPRDCVDLAWSSFAVVWLSQIPRDVPGHFFIPRCPEPQRALFDRQAGMDWERFLSLRARELRTGGRMVVVLPAQDDRGSPGFLDLMDDANAALAEMVVDGTISQHEREGMTLGSYPRSTSELLAPFAHGGQFQELTVESFKTFANPDSVWEAYELDGDREALAAKHAMFFRSTFVPSLAQALASTRNASEISAFADRMQMHVHHRRRDHPAPIDMVVQVLVVAKAA